MNQMRTGMGRGQIAGVMIAIALAMPAAGSRAFAREPAPPPIDQTASGSRASPMPEIQVADNVFVVPDMRAKAITGWLVVKAGCADEVNGDCRGLAHYLEHLQFINRDADHRMKISIFGGGTGNGRTTHKSTMYFQRFPSNPATDAANLDKLLGYFAGMLQAVTADEVRAERERNIVLQEYNQNFGSSSYRRFGIDLALALMPGDPLGQRVGGTPESIKTFTTDAARTFHKTWYTKSNAVLVLHGPIAPAAIKPLVAKYLAPLADTPLPARAWVSFRKYLPASQTFTQKAKDARSVNVYLEKVVHFDEPSSEADRRTLAAARAIIRAYLASKLAGSPLDRLLEQDALIAQGGLSVSRVRSGTLRLSFWGEPATGVAPQAVVQAVQAYVRDLPAAGIGAPVVERLKTRLANSRKLLLQQPEKTAETLVNWFMAHDSYAAWQRVDAGYAGVSTAHIDTILAALAQPGREIIGIMLPETTPAPGESAGVGVSPPPAAPETATKDP